MLFLSLSSVGYYNLGYALGAVLIFFPKAIGGVLPQLLSRAIDEDSKSEAEQLLNYAIKIFIIISIPYTIGSFILGESILSMMSNEIVANKSYKIVPIVSLGTIFFGLNLMISNVLFVYKKTYRIFRFNFYASVINIFLNIILLYIYNSIIFAAITTFLSYLFVFF